MTAMSVSSRPLSIVLLLIGSTAAITCAESAVAAQSASSAAIRKISPYTRGAMPTGAKATYAEIFGVDDMQAKLAESGALVRFNYTVTDSGRAALLGDKVATPYLLDEEAHVALQVPHMEKVGQLRQTGPQEIGKSYWMVFSNKGNLVKVGHRVSVVIGQFRVDGLIVQ